MKFKTNAGALWALNGIKEDDYVVLMQKHNPIVAGVLDNMKLASRLVHETKIPYIVHREYEGDGKFPAPDKGWAYEDVKRYARRHYDKFKRQLDEFQTRDIIIQVFCEQGLDSNTVLLCRMFIDWSMKDGQDGPGFVFMNTNLGGFRHGFWEVEKNGYEYVHGANYWSRGEPLRYLIDLHEVRDVRNMRGAYKYSHGPHCDYTDGIPSMHINAGMHAGPGHSRDWIDLNLQVDWALPQDYILRTYQAHRHALGWRWRENRWVPENAVRDDSGEYVLPPWLIHTEGGIDDAKLLARFQDQIKGIRLVPPWGNFQGWNTYYETWRNLYPEIPDPARVYARIQDWKWEVAHRHTGVTIGIIPYKLGNTSSQIPGQGFTSHTFMGRDGKLQETFWDELKLWDIPDHFVSATGGGKPPVPPAPPPPEPPKPEPPVVIEPPIPQWVSRAEFDALKIELDQLKQKVKRVAELLASV